MIFQLLMRQPSFCRIYERIIQLSEKAGAFWKITRDGELIK